MAAAAADATEAEEKEEVEEQECPKCKKGAPAWMATFADMATLLMAFFDLILSFAEFNVPKFKQISGSLKNAFGVQRQIPVVEQPKGTTILSLNFSPSPSPSVTETIKQQTTETEQPILETQNKTKDADYEKSENAEELAADLQQAIARGDIDIQVLGNKVVLNFTPTESEEKNLPQLLQQTLNSIEEAKTGAKSDTEVLFGGLEQELSKLAKAAEEALNNDGELDQSSQTTQESQEAQEKARVTQDELKVALKQEIGQGLVSVETREDKVIVTVGAGGAFPSGTAQLTNEAKNIIANIAKIDKSGNSSITVTGHTDNVPLIFGSQYIDNWDLAAARAASVVQNLAESGKVEPGRLVAISKGETMPLAPNTDSAGREKNRRIEIEIDYGKEN